MSYDLPLKFTPVEQPGQTAAVAIHRYRGSTLELVLMIKGRAAFLEVKLVLALYGREAPFVRVVLASLRGQATTNHRAGITVETTAGAAHPVGADVGALGAIALSPLAAILA